MKKLFVVVTGASGILYAREFFRHLPYESCEVHAVVTEAAGLVAEGEGGLHLPPQVRVYDEKDLAAPPASGSHPFDAMVVIPCSCATLGKLAHGIADTLPTRAGEVFLKEKRTLILVPRETPLSLIQIKNMELLCLAGAHLIPANPSFYGNPQTVEEVADTVVARVYDHLGIPSDITKRWRTDPD